MDEPLQLDEPYDTANATTQAKLDELQGLHPYFQPGPDPMLRQWEGAGYFAPLTCGECGRSWDYDTPASRCPWEADHPEPDSRTKWTVIGYDTDDGSYAVGSILGHHQVYGDDDPAGMGTWAEWVYTDDATDGNMPGRVALELRAKRYDEDEEDEE